MVTAFYVSNVEQYLFNDAKQKAFYANVATLPVDERSVFIRPYSMRRGYGGPVRSLCPITSFLRAVDAGRIYSNNDALTCPPEALTGEDRLTFVNALIPPLTRIDEERVQV